MKNYYDLTKPGIIYGNAISVLGGFFLASRGQINVALLIATLVGISLVMASGCVFNNYIDRGIDALMERTKNRVLVRGLVSKKSALVYASALGILGFLVLLLHTNLLTTAIALGGFLVYIFAYSLWAKRAGVYGTLIGSISGAVPPVVGYCAVTNHFDLAALFLFFILALWQIPHAYAIGIYRIEDYRVANIPLLPVKKGIYKTKYHTLITVLLFVSAEIKFGLLGYVSMTPYFIAVLFCGLLWITLSVKGFYTYNDRRWARNMFLLSLVVLLVFCVTIIVLSFI